MIYLWFAFAWFFGLSTLISTVYSVVYHNQLTLISQWILALCGTAFATTTFFFILLIVRSS